MIGFAVAIFLLTASPRNDVFAAENELAAVLRDGALEVSIPYDDAMARNRVLSLEILDPNDKPVARLTRPVSPSASTGSWKSVIPLDGKLALEDLAWDRLKIKAGDINRIVSLSEILRVPVVRIFAQRSYTAGSESCPVKIKPPL
jgi:hypothetical protein